MRFAQLQSAIKQSTLLPPILITILAFLLLVNEITNYFYSARRMTVAEKPSPLIPRTENLTKNSPVFNVHLFGSYIPLDLGSGKIKQSVLEAEVVGILFSDEASQTKAILRWRDGKEKSYSIGDTLQEGAIVKKILANEIVVLHHGALESLSLPKNPLRFRDLSKPVKE